MKKTRYTEEQIAFALKQAETGTRVGEVCRKMGISEATFYNWKKNVRVYSTTDIRSKKTSFEYFWYGITLPEAIAKINKTVIHLTEERESNVIEMSSFSIGNDMIQV
nr:transposase [Salmonella enterica]